MFFNHLQVHDLEKLNSATRVTLFTKNMMQPSIVKFVVFAVNRHVVFSQ